MRVRCSIVYPLVLAALFMCVGGCKKVPEVQLVRATRAPVEATVTGVSSGTVRAEQIAELAFGSVGRVRELNVKLGDRVRLGQVLAQVENQDLISRLNVAREELIRAQNLSRENAMSRSTLIQAQGAYDAAATAFEKSLIKAPFDGVIAELNLEVGQLSQITAVIPLAPIKLVDVNPRYVRVEVDEVDLSKVQVGMPARVKILAVRREPFVGKVRKIVPYISTVREQDRTSEIELTMDGEGTLLPVGASADVEIITQKKDDVVTLTTKAILGRGSERYVYALKGNRAAKTPVSVGISGFSVSEIIGGIPEGTEVIMPSDKFDLQDGVKVRVSG